MRKITLSVVFGLILRLSPVHAATVPAHATASGAETSRPRLILTIVIDQFRADYLTRFRSRFLPAQVKGGEVGGFAYLMESGAYYPFAEYTVFQNMTGPGHSMILSGSLPYQTGIPINTWYDAATGKPRYCVADESAPLVGGAPDSHGVSPRSFLGTTVGDELKNAGFGSKVVTLALKERAAVLLGGRRADLAIWMDSASFHWVSSRYYLGTNPLPGWVASMNARLDSRRGEIYDWKAAGKPTGLTLVPSGEFEHSAPFGSKESMSLPLGLELTTEMATQALHELRLGTHQDPDLFAISYSSHDYLGHLYGPNTLEMEEITVAEDRQISRLLNAVRKLVPGGLQNVAVVLTADHGIPPSASWLVTQRMDAGKLSAESMSSRIEQRLTARFGKSEEEKWVVFTADLNFYLNPKALAARKVSKEDAEAEAKAELEATPGVSTVLTEADYRARRLPPGLLGSQVLNGFYPGRSGDLIVVPKPFYMIDDDPVSHHTGYTYDRTVPVILAGGRFKSGVRAEHAAVIDIAPTLSFVLGTIPPALSEGRVLSEALR